MVAYGVGVNTNDIEMHYTTDGLVSLCGKELVSVFRWSQYPKNRGDGCDICALMKENNERGF